MRPAVVLACMVALASAQLPEPVISNNGGLEFRLRDDGYREMMIHYNINKPLNGVAAGDHMGDVRAKTGDAFVHTDPSVQLQPGDTVHYWMLVFKNTGEGLKITDRTWTYSPTPPKPTITRIPRPPTPHPTASESHLHSIASTTAPTSGSGSVIGTGSGTGSGSGTGTGSGTGSGHESGSHSGSSGPSTGSHMNGGGGNGDSSYLGSGHNGGMPFSNGGGRQGGGSGHTSGSGGGSCNCDYGPGHGDGFVDDRTCQSFPCLIFEDNFDFLNHRVWEHEITAGGGGNWEFQYYTNNRTNSYTRDGILYIKPTLTSDQYGQEFLEHGKLDLWGSSAADVCTSNMDWGCKREGQPGQVINPIQSARLRSSRGFNFRYGKVEVEAKVPTGDWLWPAIWLLPRLNVYGKWPASGEIDIMESRGNLHYRDPHGKSLGADSTGSTLHFGADFYSNQWPKAHKEVQLSAGTYADDFHKYGVEWDNTSITFTVDGAETLRVAPGPGGFWELGGLDQIPGHENPWRGASRMAPFDQEFYLLLNVAVGGVGFFKDENRNSPYPKPWQDGVGHESDRFWAARNLWYPTWHPNRNNGEDAALKVNYVRVWKTKPDPRLDGVGVEARCLFGKPLRT